MIWHRIVTDSIFKTDIQLIVCPVPEIRAWIAHHPEFEDHDSEEGWASANAETLQTTHGPGRWLVWISPTRVSVTNPEQLGTLVHETLHVTAQILGDRGVELCAESEEVFAYYQAALFEAMLRALQTYRSAPTPKTRRATATRTKRR
jgi:hypothetical protein